MSKKILFLSIQQRAFTLKFWRQRSDRKVRFNPPMPFIRNMSPQFNPGVIVPFFCWNAISDISVSVLTIYGMYDVNGNKYFLVDADIAYLVIFEQV
ncbi:MAG: hypothetical protein JW731_12520 [Bacteroidales bacterium]|nr:hypothetical protein [Bacteroidales bacterium]